MDRTIFSGGVGINNKVEPHRLPFDLKTGAVAFEEATDVLVDPTGEVSTRRGTSLLESGSFHSMWATQGGFYTIKDGTTTSDLYKVVVNSDGSLDLQGVWSGLTLNKQLSYADLDDYTLYCNGYQYGKLQDGARSAWPVNEQAREGSTKEATPIGKHIDVVSGRVLVAVGDEVFFTEYGLPGLVDPNKGRRRFEGGEVIMVASVQTGFYVSTEQAVYFVGGVAPILELPVKKVLNYPAIEYGKNQELIDPSFFGFETTQLSTLFATVNGPVVGLPDGTAVNLIDKQIKMTDCGQQTGAIMVVDESLIIQSQNY